MPHLTVADGRQVHYERSALAEAGSTALVFHHGQPGTALLWGEMVGAASEFGWPVIMVSRPGYASSDRRKGRTVADVAGDIDQVLDHLGIGRFVTAGWSGGGPHALACGALLPSRCAAVATIAGVAPHAGVDDLDWTAGMGPENVAEFESLISGDPDLEGRIVDLNRDLAELQPDQVVEALGGLLSEPDKAVMTGGLLDFMARSMRLSASNGHYGYWDDDLAFIAEWGFDLAAMAVPVTVWMADLDLMVPQSHGEWLASHVRGASGILKAGEGHISLLTRHIGEIVAGLARAAGSR